MENNNFILCVSSPLLDRNEGLKKDIRLIDPDLLFDQIMSNQFYCALFLFRDLEKVFEIKKGIEKHFRHRCRFICIDDELQPDHRLTLLDNDIEFININKYAELKPAYFKLNSSTNSNKVLFIDDDIDQIRLVEHMFSSTNIELKTLQKSDKLLDEILYYEPDLILMDYQLNTITADKFVKMIRRIPTYNFIPIVILTQDNSESTRFNLLSCGADDLITKPVNPEFLIPALTNRMKRTQNKKSMLELKPSKNHKSHTVDEYQVNNIEVDQFYEKLQAHLDDPNFSIIWIHIENSIALQKELGYTAYKNLCKIVLKSIADNKIEYYKHVSDKTLAFLSTKLPRQQVTKWAESIQEWLKTNSYSFQNSNYYIKPKILILTDVHNKPKDENLINEAEKLLLDGVFDENITHVAEGSEEKLFYTIKKQLELAIKTNDFNWWYHPIVSTNDSEQEIYQLYLRVMDESKTEIDPAKFYKVAHRTGLLQIFDRFTLEHSLRTIIINNQNKQPRKVLINQMISGYESSESRNKNLSPLSELNIPGGSLIFQFTLEDAKRNSHLLPQISSDIKKSNILLCLSNFDGSDSAWKILKKFSPDWIRVLPLSSNPNWLNKNHPDYIKNMINKAHELNVKIMVSEVNNSQFAASTWNLKFDFMQGFFIQPPIIEDELILKN